MPTRAPWTILSAPPYATSAYLWFYARGTGPVAMIESQDVSAFLLYNGDEKHEKAMAERPQ
jgi:hypothetical protein